MLKIGSTQKKIILALYEGVVLGAAYTMPRYFKLFHEINRDWQKLNQKNINRSIIRLSIEKLVKEQKLQDGSIVLILTSKGKTQARKLSFIGNQIKFKKPNIWDGLWRLVIFDIPEKDRIFRNILREHLYVLKFYKLQHSVFVSPYPFEEPILELVNLYSANSYVHVITAIKIDNEEYLKNHFLISR